MDTNLNPNQAASPTEPWEVWRERPGAADEVCRALANGSTLLRWAVIHDFDHYSVWHWLRTNPECAEQYKNLPDFRVDRLLDEMLELADDSSQDLQTDEQGKVSVNRTHLTRTRIQIDVRKNILRQLTTARRLAKDEKPQWSYEEEILKLGNDDTPYDPQGLLKGYKKPKPEFDPGPPPLSAATRQLGAAPAPLLRPLGGEGRDEGAFQSAIRTPQSAISSPSPDSLRTFPSYRAYLRAIWESGWVEGTPLPFAYHPTPNPPGPAAGQDGMTGVPGTGVGRDIEADVRLEPHLSAQPTRAERASREGEPKTETQAEAATALNTAPLKTDYSPAAQAKQPPKPTIGGVLPKVDWYGLIGVRTLSAFLTLFILFLTTAAANLHASIRSLSVPIEAKTRKRCQSPSIPPQAAFVVHSRLTPLPPSGFRLPTSSGIRNPSAHSRRSRDAPHGPCPVTPVT